MSLTGYAEEPRINPLDVVESLATGNDWSFERASDDEITILVTGRWTDYQLSYTWMGDIEALHLACAFDLRVPERRRAEVQTLISLINERLWVGHFDHWNSEGVMLTYFVFVLQKRTCGRKDRAETVLSYPRKAGRTPIGPDRSHSYRVLPGDVKCTNGHEKHVSDAGPRTL